MHPDSLVLPVQYSDYTALSFPTSKAKTDKHKYYFTRYSYGAEIIENYEGRGTVRLCVQNHDEFLGNGSDM
jgi:hypothetical protein